MGLRKIFIGNLYFPQGRGGNKGVSSIIGSLGNGFTQIRVGVGRYVALLFSLFLHFNEIFVGQRRRQTTSLLMFFQGIVPHLQIKLGIRMFKKVTCSFQFQLYAIVVQITFS